MSRAPFRNTNDFDKWTIIDPGFEIDDNQMNVRVSYTGSGDGILDLVEVTVTPRWGNRRYKRTMKRCANFSINNLLEATELTKTMNNVSCDNLRD